MDNVISIELFKQVYKFKTDLAPDISRDAVEMLQNAVAKTNGDALGAVPVTERPIILMLAALDLASDHIRLQQQYEELLDGVKSRSESLIAKLSLEM